MQVVISRSLEAVSSMLRIKLLISVAEELKKLRQETERMIQSIEADYAANHGMLASQVLHKMIEG